MPDPSGCKISFPPLTHELVQSCGWDPDCVCVCVCVPVCVCLAASPLVLLLLAGFECEKDELAELVENLKHAGVASSHRKGLTVHKKSFSGAQLLEWLQSQKGMGE